MDIDKICEILCASTPGQWTWTCDSFHGGYAGLLAFEANGGEEAVVWPTTSNEGDDGAAWFDTMSKADAALIAASPEIARLALRQAEEIENMKARIAMLQASREDSMLHESDCPLRGDLSPGEFCPGGWAAQPESAADKAKALLRQAADLVQQADAIVADLAGCEGELTSRFEMADLGPEIVGTLIDQGDHTSCSKVGDDGMHDMSGSAPGIHECEECGELVEVV